MSFRTCDKCGGPMDPMPEVYCCICTPACRVSWCWKCHRVWMQGGCARAFMKELQRDALTLAEYTTSSERPASP